MTVRLLFQFQTKRRVAVEVCQQKTPNTGYLESSMENNRITLMITSFDPPCNPQTL